MLLFAGVSVGHVTVMADLRALGLIDDSATRQHSSLSPATLLESESLFPSSTQEAGFTSLIAIESEQGAGTSSSGGDCFPNHMMQATAA
jgi:hypothetical protein